MTTRIFLPSWLYVFFVFFGPDVVQAWGKLGHEIVGNIAYGRLSSQIQTRVQTILGIKDNKKKSDDDDLDMTPLAQVANWADQVRFTKDYHWSGPLHFVDVRDDTIDGGCSCTTVSTVSSLLATKNTTMCQPASKSLCWFEYPRDCANDVCAVGAIVNYTNRLVDNNSRSHLRRVSPAQEALKFLTHFVGDIHQPLHASRKSDKGGNSIHVRVQTKGRNTTATKQVSNHSNNLHSVWDTELIEHSIRQNYNASARGFQLSVLDLVRTANQEGFIYDWLRCADGRSIQCPSAWAEESLDDALRWAYSDENGQEINDGTILSHTYMNTRIGIVRHRLAAAGVRLAAVLESVLGSGKPEANSLPTLAFAQFWVADT
mmetsp:Transcript_5411/g.7821  ORF Transcript_5411/g.7821 Transcript_5411/m.7821 type:complete len:373 (+) Transcript_5411:118-1236(+)